MESTIWFTDGFVVITGEIGSGKTTLIESFLKEVPADVVVAQINQTQVSGDRLPAGRAGAVRVLAVQDAQGRADQHAESTSSSSSTPRAGACCSSSTRRRTSPCACSRRSACSPGSRRPRRRCCASSSPGNRSSATSSTNPQLEQLTQRVRLRFHLQTLSESETHGYIQHRLEVAGAGDRALFAPDTFAEIFRYCGGVPRLINTLCDTAMMAAGTATGHRQRADIHSAVEELQWVDFAHRPRHHAAEADRLPPPMPVNPAMAARSLARLLVATDGPHRAGGAAAHRAGHRRPHAGQRRTHRQPLHQPPPLPGRHLDALLRGRGPEQHQRDLREVQPCAPPPPERWRRRC